MLPSTNDLYAHAQKLAEAGCYRRAIIAYRRLLSIDPDDARTLLKLGDLQLRLEEFDKAVSAYERVAEHYYQDGNSIKAVAVYKHIHHIIAQYAPHLERRYRHTTLRLAEIFLSLGLCDDALAATDRAAQAMIADGSAAEVPPLYQKLIDRAPDHPLAHFKLGEAQVRLGDVEHAIQHMSRAATIMVNQGLRNDALKVLETLLSYKSDPVFAGIAAKLYLHRGDRDGVLAALSKLRICYKADPDAIETLTLVAKAFDQVEQWDKALEVRKQAAWLAWQQGDKAAYEQIVSQLIARAYDDPSVMQLAALRRVPYPIESAPTPAGISGSGVRADDTVVDARPAWLSTTGNWPISA